jgi:CO/xanthine dehydrogenase FAD-binding subunit
MLPEFNYHRVHSPEEAVRLLTLYAGNAKILAGGTDLLLQMKRRKTNLSHVISLKEIESLNPIRATDRYIILGANTTHHQIEASSLIQRELKALHDAVGQVGSIQIRNVATVAGNICNAAPSADTAAPLLALEATLRVVGKDGERRIPLKDFYQGPGRSILKPDEVLLEILIPKPKDFSSSSYYKLARRKAMDLALMGAATSITCSDDKKWIKEVRIALTTVAPTPIRAFTAENLLKDMPISQEALKQAAELAALEANPRTSWRSTAEYRKQMVRVFVYRSLLKSLERLEIKVLNV